ncbi:MAG: hypothetical protein KC587_19105, partial [Nitrospira sp.]|nr:hypothetical protein [Nitrospira sp.]
NPLDGHIPHFHSPSGTRLPDLCQNVTMLTAGKYLGMEVRKVIHVGLFYDGDFDGIPVHRGRDATQRFGSSGLTIQGGVSAVVALRPGHEPFGLSLVEWLKGPVEKSRQRRSRHFSRAHVLSVRKKRKNGCGLPFGMTQGRTGRTLRKAQGMLF